MQLAFQWHGIALDGQGKSLRRKALDRAETE